MTASSQVEVNRHVDYIGELVKSGYYYFLGAYQASYGLHLTNGDFINIIREKGQTQTHDRENEQEVLKLGTQLIAQQLGILLND